VEANAANLCLVVRRGTLRSKRGWDGLLASMRAENRHLRERLDGATPLWSKPLAIFPIPYGYRTADASGIWRVGDQAAVIPSFTGDGMSIALHSGALAAQMALAGRSPAEYHAALATQLRSGMRLSTLISRAMLSSAGRGLTPGLLSLVPGAMQWIAASTRIPAQAMAEVAVP